MSTKPTVAETQRVRKPIPHHLVVEQFMQMLARGLDEGHIATRMGR